MATNDPSRSKATGHGPDAPNPDDTIYYSTRGNGSAQYYHLNRDCCRLGIVEDVREKSFRHRPLSIKPCSYCAIEVGE